MGRACQVACALVVILAVIASRSSTSSGQAPTAGFKRFVYDIAPPAIESGTRPYRWAAPDSEETRRRLTLRSATSPVERKDSAGRTYVAGRVIVKFRSDASAEQRAQAVREVSASGTLTPRPSYADFDVITIDPGADAEAAAKTFAERPDVEFAQPSYRMRPKFKPNDRFYNEQ